MELLELLREAFDGGSDCSELHNCGDCDGAFKSFDDWLDDYIEKHPDIKAVVNKNINNII
jgi:hypothetical protein